MNETVHMAEMLILCNIGLVPHPCCQTHEHTHTCFKNGRTKWRFNAPYWTAVETTVVTSLPAITSTGEGIETRVHVKQKYTKIYEALETITYNTIEDQNHNVKYNEECLKIVRSGISQLTRMLKRSPKDIKVNYSNLCIASVLDSNMDVQVVLDVYAYTYIVEYVNKASRCMSNLHKEIRKIIEEKSLKLE